MGSDATWFAVDRDGHVGVFSSGEWGGVPRAVTFGVGQEDRQVESAIAKLASTSDVELDLSCVLHPGRRPQAPLRRTRTISPPFRDERLYLVSRDVDVLLSVQEQLGGRLREEGLATILAIDGVLENVKDPRVPAWCQALRALRDRAGLVQAHGVGSELARARRGVFTYFAHDERFGRIPEPYGRELVPTQPLRVDLLPSKLGERLMRTARLDVSFREARYIQPAAHVDCYRGIYLATDGFTVRSEPGCEETFDEVVGDLEYDPDDPTWLPVVFDRPGGERRRAGRA